jgi:hypothetical protein
MPLSADGDGPLSSDTLHGILLLAKYIVAPWLPPYFGMERLQYTVTYVCMVESHLTYHLPPEAMSKAASSISHLQLAPEFTPLELYPSAGRDPLLQEQRREQDTP